MQGRFDKWFKGGINPRLRKTFCPSFGVGEVGGIGMGAMKNAQGRLR